MTSQKQRKKYFCPIPEQSTTIYITNLSTTKFYKFKYLSDQFVTHSTHMPSPLEKACVYYTTTIENRVASLKD